MAAQRHRRWSRRQRSSREADGYNQDLDQRTKIWIEGRVVVLDMADRLQERFCISIPHLHLQNTFCICILRFCFSILLHPRSGSVTDSLEFLEPSPTAINLFNPILSTRQPEDQWQLARALVSVWGYVGFWSAAGLCPSLKINIKALGRSSYRKKNLYIET